MDLRRAVPISNLRAIGFASVALLLILGYGVFGYLDQRARAAVAKTQQATCHSAGKHAIHRLIASQRTRRSLSAQALLALRYELQMGSRGKPVGFHVHRFLGCKPMFALLGVARSFS